MQAPTASRLTASDRWVLVGPSHRGFPAPRGSAGARRRASACPVTPSDAEGRGLPRSPSSVLQATSRPGRCLLPIEARPVEKPESLV